MKNKCLLVLLLALGCCHVQAQKSQKDPLSEALVRLNQKVDSELIPGIKRFPLIGISTDISPKRTAVNTAYVQSVILSGGIPYMIPVTDNVEILRENSLSHESSSEVISRVYASISLRKVSAGSSPRSMRARFFSHSPVMATSAMRIVFTTE